MNRMERAILFAHKAHKGQYRKYSGEPYICHPIAVAATLEKFGYSDNVIIAGLFHYIVEDTKVTSVEIAEKFGIDVAKLVLEVTDISKPSDGNREIRKSKI